MENRRERLSELVSESRSLDELGEKVADAQSTSGATGVRYLQLKNRFDANTEVLRKKFTAIAIDIAEVEAAE